MLNREREQEILNILKSEKCFVTVKHLCEALFASESSIRRDLKALEKRGQIKRSYGGASLDVSASDIVTFGNRTRQNTEAKRTIAKKAAALINDGDLIFLDQSSTSFYVAAEIVDKSSVTVITNNIEIMILLSNSGVKVISSGGFLSDSNRNCLIGGEAQRTFDNAYADILFFSVKALSENGDVTDCSTEEIAVRNSMLKNSAKKVLLCDSSKFGKKAVFRQCTLKDVDILISEGEAANKYLKDFDNIVTF